MLRAFCAIFSLAVAAAGWYYMFYSRAASRLSGIEDAHVNSMRIWLRKINGLLMFLLAISFFAGFFAVDLDHPTRMTAFVWLAVCGLVLALLALGLGRRHVLVRHSQPPRQPQVHKPKRQ